LENLKKKERELFFHLKKNGKKQLNFCLPKKTKQQGKKKKKQKKGEKKKGGGRKKEKKKKVKEEKNLRTRPPA